MKNKKSKINKLPVIFGCAIIAAALFCGGFSASADSEKIMVDDNDRDGKISIGDKFCLGKECFYVTNNSDNKITALTEYNLYVGANYSKLILDNNSIYIRAESINDGTAWGNYAYFFEGEQLDNERDWRLRIKEKYNAETTGNNIRFNNESIVHGESYTLNGKTYQNWTLKFYPADKITSSTEGYGIQNELARGVTGEKGNANYPIYATTNLGVGYWSWENFNLYKEGYIDFDIEEDGAVPGYLNGYKEYLVEENPYEISDIHLLRMEDLDKLIKELSGSYLPLSDWYQAAKDDWDSDELGSYSNLGDLKGILSDDYAWLWNTTYWLQTFAGESDAIGNPGDYYGDYPYVYFVSSAGDICFADACYNSVPRAGIRPAITMAADQFELNIMDIVGSVRWIDNNNYSGIRPLKSTIRLYQNGVLFDTVTVTKDEDEDFWRFSFRNVPKYDEHGELYKYTITQDGVAMYASDITNFDVVNRYTPDSNSASSGGSSEKSVKNPNTSVGSPIFYIAGVSAMLGASWFVFRMKRR